MKVAFKFSRVPESHLDLALSFPYQVMYHVLCLPLFIHPHLFVLYAISTFSETSIDAISICY